MFAIILNKVPEKLEDLGKFRIPCALQELDRTNALADFGASINLLPHSIYKQLGLGTPDVSLISREDLSFALQKLSLINTGKKYIKNEPFSGSTTNHFDALPPSSSPVKTSDNLEEFADELTILKNVFKKEIFKFIQILFLNLMIISPLATGQYIEIDAFLAMEVSSNFEEGYYDSEGDVIFLKSLLSDDTTHNLSPEVISDHEPKQNESIHYTLITFSPRSDPLHHEFAGELLTLP
ncbi:hypothetical protein Tco_0490920 [Tanacetum coccineum]